MQNMILVELKSLAWPKWFKWCHKYDFSTS